MKHLHVPGWLYALTVVALLFSSRPSAQSDLDARLRKFEQFFTFVTNPYTGDVGVMTSGRFGVMTNYWMVQPYGEGAALSCGTISDRYCGYFEIDAVANWTKPSTALMASNVAINWANQNNIAIEAYANNAPLRVIILANGDGIQLDPSVTKWFLGKPGGTIKQLWP